MRLHIGVVLTSKVYKQAATLTSHFSLFHFHKLLSVCVPLDESISLHSVNLILLVKSLDTLKACSRALENHYQLSVNMHYATANYVASIVLFRVVTIDCH